MERSIYLDDYTCEMQPCEPTLEGYAAFLSGGGNSGWPVPDVPENGQTFTGSALAWKPDIIATRLGGKWSLSRNPGEDDFVAVRFGEGLGWSPDNIIYEEMGMVEGEYTQTETMTEALMRWFEENDEHCDDTEFVAVAESQDGLLFEYRSEPARLIEVTAQ